MEDQIIKKRYESGTMTVNLKTGEQVPVKANTVYTYWKSGRKDCKIELLEPLNLTAIQEKL